MKPKNSLSITDSIIKKSFSIIYRLLITAISIFIICSQSNLFTHWYYYAFIITYLIIYSQFYSQTTWKFSLIRLINDCSLIFLILYGKDINQPINYFLIILPIINSPNQSGEKSHLLYPMIITMLGLLSSWKFERIALVPVITLYVINLLRQYRAELLEAKNDLIDLISQSFTKEYEFRKIHHLYDEILQHFASNKQLCRFFEIDILICFLLKNDQLLLINSSKFISAYEIINQDKIVSTLKKNGTARDFPIRIMQNTFDKNLYVMAKDENMTLVFTVIVKNEYVLNIGMNLLSYYFRPISDHLLKIIKHYGIVRKSLDDSQSLIKRQQQYVLKSTNAMHYVRNKLTPIKTYLNLDKLDEQIKKMDPITLSAFKNIEQKSLRNAKFQLQNIIERADFILEKSDNPFVIKATSTHRINSLFSLIRVNWLSYFDDQKLEIDLSESFQSIHVNYTPEIMEIVLTDLMSNMKKYGSHQKLVLIEEDGHVMFYFQNTINDLDEKKVKEYEKLIMQYNGDDSWEINKRNSHGLSLIKSYLNQMDIRSEIVIQDLSFIFKMKLRKTKS